MRYILSIKCKDTKGLVFKVSSVLLLHNLNIEQNSEFVDKENKIFFMRTEISGEVNESTLLDDVKNTLNCDCEVSLKQLSKKSIVILATKENHCLGDLLISHHSGELRAEIKAIISNHDVLRSLSEKFDIPFYFIDSKINNKADIQLNDRLEHEKKIIEVIDKFSPNYLVLAKYMRILSPSFIGLFKDRIINIHHSFLPAFIGASPYRQAYDRGVKIIGATAHFVNDNLDEGPIIYQDIIKVDHSYSWQDMQSAGKHVEKVVLARALDLVFQDKVFIHDNKTIVL